MNYKSGTVFTASASTARVGSGRPSQFRFAQYPDGSTRLQGVHEWRSDVEGGVTWIDIPTVKVNELGVEA